MGTLSVTRALALSGVVASGIAASASCTSTSPSGVGGDPLDAAGPRDATQDTTTPTVDAVVPADAGPSDDDAAFDATDGSDANVPKSTCTGLPPLLCNFDGICPPLAAFIAGNGGQPSYALDAGPDGSKALRAPIPDGGIAMFGMPFREPDPNGPTPSIAHCRVTCEANLRIEEGTSIPITVVTGNENETFELGLQDGGWVQRTAPDAATTASHGAAATSDWVHVTVRLTPLDGGGATSEVTLLAADASSTTTVPIAQIGGAMRFGALRPPGTGPAVVYADDIICRVSE